MYRVEISPSQYQVLFETLEKRVEELSGEIQHTDTYEYRDALKMRRDVVQGILDLLKVQTQLSLPIYRIREREVEVRG